jgi:uncharacterized protein (DUF608 family)
MPPEDEQGCGPGCGCVDRRTFLTLTGAAGLALAGPDTPAPAQTTDFDKLIPAQKKLEAAWLRSLTERGRVPIYRADELRWTGMPVGGVGAGQLYLGGDGKLWHWDLFNTPPPGRFARGAGPNYANPPAPTSPIEQGFALKFTAGGKTSVRALDRTGFRDVSFRPTYPIAVVEYRDPDCPVTVTLEAFAPFIPLSVADSNLPATVLHFTIHNPGKQAVLVELAGWLENACCLASGKPGLGRRCNRVLRGKGLTLLHCTAEPAKRTAGRPDIVFEDFEKERYTGWKVEGKAFGSGPIQRSAIPAYQGDVGGKGQRVVNSHASAPGKTIAEKDAQTGKLTSKPFKIERGYVHFYIGGGNHPGKTCLNLLAGGKVARTAAGRNDNRMRLETFDVRDLGGQEAVIEIVDAATGAWGNIGVDHIVFSDSSTPEMDMKAQPDFGELALGLLGRTDGDFSRPRLALAPREAAFGEAPALDEASAVFGRKLVGALGRRGKLGPGKTWEATFVLGWYFPALLAGKLDRLATAAKLKRSYSTRFDKAPGVVRHVAENFERLAGQTRLWARTWYDSTLPYWLLDRSFWTLCCLATATCYHLSNGRFYGFEGTYCCDGTCTHVWQYAQGLARIFPSLERDLREKIDYGLAFHADSGAIDYRGEYGRQVAHDGQAGTVLRAYREHLTAPDDGYLQRIWSRIKKSLEYLIARDTDGDGLLDGEQYNTLDASWYGQIAWISSLYLAALRAGAAMARERGDGAFAKRCEALADKGRASIVKKLFNGEYFIQRVDPKHPGAINSNDGCHIDQVFGQAWAFQVGLPRVVPRKQTRQALESLWKYNFTADVGPYRTGFKAIPGGRWYAMPGEGGLVMCTWPRGGAEKARGKGDATFAGYFNECMAGFEYQVAAHMIWEGLVEKGLAVARMVHDRYHPSRRNPFNDVECSDHYARAMSSYGIFLAACGFEYHGPKGHLGFAPRLSPERFRAAFTAAEGWGTFAQQRGAKNLKATIDLKWGKLRLASLALELPTGAKVAQAKARVGGRAVAVRPKQAGRRVELVLASTVTLEAGQGVEVMVTYREGK